MPETPSTVIARMNAAYNAIYVTLSRETRQKAERTFYSCHDWLQDRGIRFHQALDGKWVIDADNTETKQ